MSRDYVIYLKDIFENMQNAENFIKGISYKEFVDDKKHIMRYFVH